MGCVSDRPEDARLEAKAERRGITIASPGELVLALLFVQGSIQSPGAQGGGAAPLRFFVNRAGGVHLLLSLLSAYYNKTAAGRMPGWTFGVLRQRIGISARALRTLIGDAIDLGLAVQLSGRRDRRCKVYCVTRQVVSAWEALFEDLQASLPTILASCGPSELADLDFRRSWRRLPKDPLASAPTCMPPRSPALAAPSLPRRSRLRPLDARAAS